MAGQFCGEVDGGDHSVGAGDAFPGDVGRGAVVGGGAHEREAERDVHAVVEREQLGRRGFCPCQFARS